MNLEIIAIFMVILIHLFIFFGECYCSDTLDLSYFIVIFTHNINMKLLLVVKILLVSFKGAEVQLRNLCSEKVKIEVDLI